MVKYRFVSLMMLVAAILILAPVSDADAKRFGGGRSFGGRSLYSTPYRRSQIPKRPSYTQQKAIQRNQASRQSWRNRGGFLGMLAPFLIGGLLGSLFFGGAFENLNLADLLVFGGLAWLGFKLLSQKRSPLPETSYGHGPPSHPEEPHPDRSSPPQAPARGFETDLMFGKKGRPGEESGTPRPDVPVPSDLDVESLLTEARQIFINLQEAWNRDELADIRGLTTDDVFIEIKDQRNQAGQSEPTRILELNAQLLDFREDGKIQEASILFDALLQEGDQPPEQVKEVWHFVRSKHDFTLTWLLDGIQQVD